MIVIIIEKKKKNMANKGQVFIIILRESLVHQWLFELKQQQKKNVKWFINLIYKIVKRHTYTTFHSGQVNLVQNVFFWLKLNLREASFFSQKEIANLFLDLIEHSETNGPNYLAHLHKLDVLLWQFKMT